MIRSAQEDTQGPEERAGVPIEKPGQTSKSAKNKNMLIRSICPATVASASKDEDGVNTDCGDETSTLLAKSKSDDDYERHSHLHDPTLETIEKVCFLVIWPLDRITNVEKLPEVALALVFVIIYFLAEFILTVFNVFSVYTGLSHFLVGLTLMVWGSDSLELINMSIAIKNKQVELGMTSVMSC